MSLHLIKVIKSLMSLRKTSSIEVARSAGINHETFKQFINGKGSILKRESLQSALCALGVVEGRMSDSVHQWHVPQSFFGHQHQRYENLKYASGMVKYGELVLLVNKKIKYSSTYLLGMPNGAKIYIVDHHGAFKTSQVETKLGVMIIRAVEISDKVWSMIQTGDLSASEFDMVLSGDGSLNGWREVRLVAGEYGVTSAEIIQWTMTQGEVKDKQFKLKLVDKIELKTKPNSRYDPLIETADSISTEIEAVLIKSNAG